MAIASSQIVGAVSIGEGAITNVNVNDAAEIARSKLALDSLLIYDVKLTDFRVHDAFQTALPGTSSSDDLGLYGNTFGTNTPLIRTYDVKAAGALTLRARVLIPLPAEYQAGQTVTLRFFAGAVTTAADNSMTLDCEVYESPGSAAALGSDLCATSAININNTTFANRDFTITPTDLIAGDLLDVRVTVAVNDAATGTAVIAGFGKCQLLADVRG